MRLYTISEISEETGLTPHTLRFYEKEALLPDVSRDEAGRRSYSEFHLRVLKFINALRATGMSIRDIRTYGELYLDGDATRQARRELLEKHRDRIREELRIKQKNLGIIEAKIAGLFGN